MSIRPALLLVASFPALCCLACPAIAPAAQDSSSGPVQVSRERFRPLLLGDGRLFGISLDSSPDEREHAIVVRTSADNGRSWSDKVVLHTLPQTDPEDAWADLIPLLDAERNRLHVFLLKWEDRNLQFPARKLAAWHLAADLPYGNWSEPVRLFDGYIGALRSAVQLSSGTIVLPFAYLGDRSWRSEGDGLLGYVYMGRHTSTAVYSTDAGLAFHKSPSDLTVPTPSLVEHLGAVEPVCLPLNDGRVWMMIRTQLGRQWEAFSRDGISWTRPRPSRFFSSDSPVSLTRLRDGRIVMIWNNCLRYPYAHGGRQVLHAAVSDDDGRTWRGFREILRDPLRDQPAHPITGDHGTGYADAAATLDGQLVVSTGQGATGGVYLFDPDWLTETRQHDDFSDGLDRWSVFGTRGAELVDHPQRSDTRALRISRTDVEYPAAAVWNFPNARRGLVRMRLLRLEGEGTTSICLTDHFSTPFDQEAELEALFQVNVSGDPQAARDVTIPAGTWHDLELKWDFENRRCTVHVFGEPAATLPQLRLDSHGVNYLRIRSTSETPTNSAGILIESVSAEIDPN